MATTKIQTFPGDLEVTSNLTVDTSTLRVDAINNKVGIGIASPTSDLHVVGNVGIGSSFYVGDGALSNLHADPTTGKVGFGQATGTERFEVKSDTDVTAIIGDCRVGYMDNDTDQAAWGCLTHTGTNEWGLLQNSGGTTIINTNGVIEFREANAIKHVIGGTSASNSKVGFNTNNPHATHRTYVNGLMRHNHPIGRASRTSLYAFPNTNTHPIDWGAVDSAETNRVTYSSDPHGLVLPVKGVYEVSWYVNTYSTGTSARAYDISVYLNGSALQQASRGVFTSHGYRYKNTNTYQAYSMSFMHEFNADDVVGLQVEGRGAATGIFEYNRIYATLVHPT